METKPQFTPNPDSKLMDQVREVLRYHQYAYRTEQSYCQWILRYIHFYGKKVTSHYLWAQATFTIRHSCMLLAGI